MDRVQNAINTNHVQRQIIDQMMSTEMKIGDMEFDRATIQNSIEQIETELALIINDKVSSTNHKQSIEGDYDSNTVSNYHTCGEKMTN